MGKQKNIKISEKKEIEIGILYKSLIGTEIEVVESKNKNQIGLKGVIVYESYNLVFLEIAKDNIKRLLKEGLVIRFDYEGKKIKLDCSFLSGTIVSRLKKMK